ncbi:MAG: hypothetical protein FJ004_01885 [Chloroflexi bacterium]|nr:hypothetical protein [Chloroflexota bacterium]
MPKWEKSLTIGILFFIFSLTLFGVSQPSWMIKVAAVSFFVISMLFLVKILWDVAKDVVRVLSRKSVVAAAQTSSVRETIGVGAYVWKVLWPLMILAFLTGYALSLGNGTAQMEWKTFENSVEVVGIIWFFVVCSALWAAPMQQKLKPVGNVMIAAISLGLMIYGIVCACIASDHQGFLNGTFVALLGFIIPIAFLAKHTLARYAPF